MAKNLRARLLTEAVAVFEEQAGVHDLNMRELARRCDVSHAAPYRHFDDPDALVRAVARRGFELLDAEHHAVLAELTDADPIERYVAIGLHYVDWATENRGYFYAMAEAGPLAGDEVDGAWPGALARQLDLVVAAQSTGWRAGDRPELLALGAWIYTQGVVRLLLSGELDRLGDGVSLAKALIKEAASVQVAHADTLRMLHRPRHPDTDSAHALLDATAELVAQDGLAAFSLREAARRSGVSTSAPAKLFGDREGTLRALAMEGYDELDAHLAATLVVGPDDDPLRAVADAYARFVEQHPGHAEVMWRSDLHPAGERTPAWHELPALVRLREVCQAWVDEHGSEMSGDELAFTALAVAHGAAMLWLEGSTPSRFDGLDLPDLADLAVRTLAAERDALGDRPLGG